MGRACSPTTTMPASQKDHPGVHCQQVFLFMAQSHTRPVKANKSITFSNMDGQRSENANEGQRKSSRKCIECHIYASDTMDAVLYCYYAN